MVFIGKLSDTKGMTAFNRAFVETPLVARGLPDTPAGLIPKRLGSVVCFESLAPPWLLITMRNVMLDYLPIKHLRMIEETLVADEKSDPSIQYEYLKHNLSLIICHDGTPIGARFSLNYTNKFDGLVCLQMEQFKPRDRGASTEAFEGAIYFSYLHAGCKLEVDVEVVETALPMAVKPIVTNMTFLSKREFDMSLGRETVDQVFEMREELDVPTAADPYQVTVQLHGNIRSTVLFERAKTTIKRYLDAIVADLARSSALTVTDLNVSGRGYKAYALRIEESRGHIGCLLMGFVARLSDVEGKLYKSFVANFDPITSVSTIRIVFTGTEAELTADLTAQMTTLSGLVAQFNTA